MKKSAFLSINWADALKAFVVAALAFVFNYIQTEFLPGLQMDPQIKILIAAGLAYLTKQFFTDGKTAV